MASVEIELSECTKCEICIGLCPEVFSMNDLDFIEIRELSEYPVEDVLEAVKNCPADCISYNE